MNRFICKIEKDSQNRFVVAKGKEDAWVGLEDVNHYI